VLLVPLVHFLNPLTWFWRVYSLSIHVCILEKYPHLAFCHHSGLCICQFLRFYETGLHRPEACQAEERDLSIALKDEG
jgi:hypothetical protein